MGENIELNVIAPNRHETNQQQASESPNRNSPISFEGSNSIHPAGSKHQIPVAWAAEESGSRSFRVIGFFKAFWNGPQVPRDEQPRAIQWLSVLESLPRKFYSRTSKRVRLGVFTGYILLWLVLWSRILLPYLIDTPLDNNGNKVISIPCGQAEQFWSGKNAACGLDAKDCPFVDTSEDVVIRCPALCDRESWVYSSKAVGPNIIKYRGFFIGGGSRKESSDVISHPYRADSFPCGAAVHSGIVSPFFGGCARVSFSSGPQSSFEAKKGHYGVSDSIEFSSHFPLSYVFKALSASPGHCYDPRLLVLVANILLGLPIVYLAPGVVLFWTLAIVGFWTIVSATDPPVSVEPQYPESFYQLISLGLERFLPTCFVLFALWKLSVKRTFETGRGELSRSSSAETLHEDIPGHNGAETRDHRNVCESPITRLLLWYPLFWLGVLNNITFDRLPVDRLTWHDLQEQPGALLTVSIIFLLLISCVVAQAYYVWLSGRFWKLLSVYGGIFTGLFLLGNLPGLTLRVHHYIFGLIFIPGCSTRGRTAYAFQGILLGLFLSGVARWGYASISETDFSLLRGEPSGHIASPMITNFDSGLLHWKLNETIDSSEFAEPSIKHSKVSLLVNDIERFRGESNGTVDIAQLLEANEDLSSLIHSKESEESTPVYLRLAQFSEKHNTFGDYTRAAILKLPSFEFEAPPPGIT